MRFLKNQWPVFFICFYSVRTFFQLENRQKTLPIFGRISKFYFFEFLIPNICSFLLKIFQKSKKVCRKNHPRSKIKTLPVRTCDIAGCTMYANIGGDYPRMRDWRVVSTTALLQRKIPDLIDIHQIGVKTVQSPHRILDSKIGTQNQLFADDAFINKNGTFKTGVFGKIVAGRQCGRPVISLHSLFGVSMSPVNQLSENHPELQPPARIILKQWCQPACSTSWHRTRPITVTGHGTIRGRVVNARRLTRWDF